MSGGKGKGWRKGGDKGEGEGKGIRKEEDEVEEGEEGEGGDRAFRREGGSSFTLFEGCHRRRLLIDVSLTC